MKSSTLTLVLGGLILVGGIGGLALRAHAPDYDENTATAIPETYPADVTLRLSQIGRMVEIGEDPADAEMFFDVYVDRTDLDLKEPDNPEGSIFNSDLSPEQQLTGIELNGMACEYQYIPHRCWVESGGTYTLQLNFEDGGTASATLEVPEAPEALIPELLEPTTLPNQGDPLAFEFLDVGADTYNVQVHFCGPYKNDGINPCLDGEEFWLEQVDNAWTFSWPNETATVELSPDGSRLKIIDSDQPVSFEESILYDLCAYTYGLRDDGVGTFTSACTSVEFAR